MSDCVFQHAAQSVLFIVGGDDDGDVDLAGRDLIGLFGRELAVERQFLFRIVLVQP